MFYITISVYFYDTATFSINNQKQNKFISRCGIFLLPKSLTMNDAWVNLHKYVCIHVEHTYPPLRFFLSFKDG